MLEDLLNIYDDFTKNERTQSLSTFAYENDFDFIKREPFGEQSTILREFEIFSKKGAKRLLGIMHIPAQVEPESEIRFYDYVSTKDLETRTTSIVEIFSPSLANIQLRIKPRKGFSNPFLASKETYKEFRKSYKTIPDLSLPFEAMESILSQKKLQLEIRNNVLLAYRRNKKLKLSEILDMVNAAEDISHYLNTTEQDDFV